MSLMENPFFNANFNEFPKENNCTKFKNFYLALKFVEQKYVTLVVKKHVLLAPFSLNVPKSKKEFLY